jgi:hypothetical protein
VNREENFSIIHVSVMICYKLFAECFVNNKIKILFPGQARENGIYPKLNVPLPEIQTGL